MSQFKARHKAKRNQLPSVGDGPEQSMVGFEFCEMEDNLLYMLVFGVGFVDMGKDGIVVLPGEPHKCALPCDGVHLQNMVDKIREIASERGVTII